MTFSDENKTKYAQIIIGCKDGALNGSIYHAMILGMWCHTLNQKNPLPLDTSKTILDAFQDGYAASIQAMHLETSILSTKKKKKFPFGGKNA